LYRFPLPKNTLISQKIKNKPQLPVCSPEEIQCWQQLQQQQPEQQQQQTAEGRRYPSLKEGATRPAAATAAEALHISQDASYGPVTISRGNADVMIHDWHLCFLMQMPSKKKPTAWEAEALQGLNTHCTFDKCQLQCSEHVQSSGSRPMICRCLLKVSGCQRIIAPLKAPRHLPPDASARPAVVGKGETPG